MKISTILDSIDMGSIALPEFQRGFVWNRDQVRGLMSSLYRRHPVGSLLVWATNAETALTRGADTSAPGIVKLLLDGQQRVTTLYGIIKGTPPEFFDGNPKTFTGLYFNLEDETFEFYTSKMKDNLYWISVTDLMKRGLGSLYSRLAASEELKHKSELYFNRANAIYGIKDIDLYVEEVTGEDKTIDVVVDIFNRVNSGGTKLSNGDLALAKICASWPEARKEIKLRLESWENAGYSFKKDWLLRNMTTVITGKPYFSELAERSVSDYKNGLVIAEKVCNYLLNAISMRLGLDHDRVLGARYAFPVMSRYLYCHGGQFSNAQERDKLLYWYIHCFLWGRYATSVESTMAQDLADVQGNPDDLDKLIAGLEKWRGMLTIRPEDFSGWGRGSRFYPLLYLLTRVYQAKDWSSGLQLAAHLLGKTSTLHVHHIFPKSILYTAGFSRMQVNAVANYCFLTQDANLNISAKAPEMYFEEVEERFPGALESQWIPMDKKLWKTESYLDFLGERKRLLASATNDFLEKLINSPTQAITDSYTTELPPIDIGDQVDDELIELLQTLRENNLPLPEVDYEVAHPGTGEVLANVDLAWPDGLQPGYSQPLVFCFEPDPESVITLTQYNYLCIIGLENLKTILRTLVYDVQAS